MPPRNFVSSSYLQGGTNVSFLVLKRFTTSFKYCRTVDRAVKHLLAAPMGSDLFWWWAGCMPVLSILPLVEDQYVAVLFHLASSGLIRKLITWKNVTAVTVLCHYLRPTAENTLCFGRKDRQKSLWEDGRKGVMVVSYKNFPHNLERVMDGMNSLSEIDSLVKVGWFSTGMLQKTQAWRLCALNCNCMMFLMINQHKKVYRLLNKVTN